MWTRRPFALFVLVELEPETIDKILQEAINGCSISVYWLAEKGYHKAPEIRHHESNLGTEAPINNAWTSPWIGSKAEDAAKWLREKPDSVDLDSNHFAVLDARAVDKSVVLCKIGDEDLHGDALSMIRYLARDSSNFLLSMTAFSWENKFEGVGGEKMHAEIDYGDSK